jgi:hypothetical protein
MSRGVEGARWAEGTALSAHRYVHPQPKEVWP